MRDQKRYLLIHGYPAFFPRWKKALQVRTFMPKTILKVDFNNLPEPPSTIEIKNETLDIPYGFFNPFDNHVSIENTIHVWQNRFRTRDGRYIYSDWTMRALRAFLRPEAWNAFENWLLRHYKRCGCYGAKYTARVHTSAHMNIQIAAQNDNDLVLVPEQEIVDVLPGMYEYVIAQNTNRIINRPLRRLKGILRPKRKIPGWATDADPRYIANKFNNAINHHEARQKFQLFCLPDMSHEASVSVMNEVLGTLAEKAGSAWESYIGIHGSWNTDCEKMAIIKSTPKYIFVFNPKNIRMRDKIRALLEQRIQITFNAGYFRGKQREVAIAIRTEPVETLSQTDCDKFDAEDRALSRARHP